MAVKLLRLLGCCTLVLLSAVPLAQAASPSAQALRDTGAERYTLALTWQAGFCRIRGMEGRACRQARRRDGAESGFALHGLWPSLPARFAEQGVSARRWRSQGCFLERPRKGGGFCAAGKAFEFDAAFASRLNDAMPGRARCLDRYQYAKHAACLAVPAEPYFATALALLAKVNDSAFADFLMINRGATLEIQTLFKAFEGAFGKGTKRALSLSCKGPGQRVLTEVRIGIDAEHLSDFPAVKSLVPLRPGRCAPRVQVLAQ